MIQKAAQRQFEHDGYLAKDVLVMENGAFKQVKQKGLGVLVYVGVAAASDTGLAGFTRKAREMRRIKTNLFPWPEEGLGFG